MTKKHPPDDYVDPWRVAYEEARDEMRRVRRSARAGWLTAAVVTVICVIGGYLAGTELSRIGGRAESLERTVDRHVTSISRMEGELLRVRPRLSDAERRLVRSTARADAAARRVEDLLVDQETARLAAYLATLDAAARMQALQGRPTTRPTEPEAAPTTGPASSAAPASPPAWVTYLPEPAELGPASVPETLFEETLGPMMPYIVSPIPPTDWNTYLDPFGEDLTPPEWFPPELREDEPEPPLPESEPEEPEEGPEPAEPEEPAEDADEEEG